MPSIVFIDSRVAAIESLLTGLAQDVRVVMLDVTQDGVEQIAAALNGITDLSAIHIISHGSQGALYLGCCFYGLPVAPPFTGRNSPFGV